MVRFDDSPKGCGKPVPHAGISTAASHKMVLGVEIPDKNASAR